MDEVVPGKESEGFEVFECVLGFFAGEARFVDAFEVPAVVIGKLEFGLGQLGMSEGGRGNYLRATLIPDLISF